MEAAETTITAAAVREDSVDADSAEAAGWEASSEAEKTGTVTS